MKNTREIVVIMGPGRTGTTLMSALLDGHNDLTGIPLEIKFFVRAKDNDTISNYTHIFIDSKMKFVFNKNEGFDVFNSGRIDFSRVDREKFSNEINLLLLDNTIVSLGRYIEIIHDLYESCFRGGEVRKIIFLKEGNHALPAYHRIVSHFSNVKFIVLSRNPKDCFSSEKLSGLSKSITFSGSNLLEFLFAYKSSFIQYEKFQLLNLENNKIFFIRYEDLVLNLEKSMENICEFLNIDYSDSLLMPTTAGLDWGGNSSSNIAQHIVTSESINNYLKHLTDNEVTFIDYYLSKYQALNKYNFILTENKLHLLAKLSPHLFPKISVDYKDFLRPYVRIIRWLKNCIMLFYMAMVKK